MGMARVALPELPVARGTRAPAGAVPSAAGEDDGVELVRVLGDGVRRELRADSQGRVMGHEVHPFAGAPAVRERPDNEVKLRVKALTVSEQAAPAFRKRGARSTHWVAAQAVKRREVAFF